MPGDGVNLTVFLLKPDQVDAFNDRFPAAGALQLADGIEGRFVALPGAPSTPRWVPALNAILADGTPGLNLQAQSPAGLLVIEREGRTYVVSFGSAWQKVDDEWVERDFGRRVALNLMKADGVVEIRAEQVFAKWHLASDRAPRASSVEEFGVEFDRDLVAAVEGVPIDAGLGRTVRGGTSLRVALPLRDLLPLLDRAEKLFRSDAYKKKWPDIDNLSPVKHEGTMQKLDAQLDADLIAGVAQKRLVMFTPAHRRDEPLEADSYVFGRLTKNPAMTPYLAVEQWLSFLAGKGLEPSVAEARRTAIHLLDESAEELKTCTAFDCFGYEVAHAGRPYVLSSGTWYEVATEFLERVNRAMAALKAPKLSLPTWDQVESEREYNAKCCQSPGFWLFDAKKVWYGGKQSQFEFCDVMHPESHTLLFAKIASRSSGMSHLLEQVRRTAELFFGPDEGYRKQLKKKFLQMHPDQSAAWLKQRPRAGDWSLCLVSLGRTPTSLPFFAKCGLMTLRNELVRHGHAVSFLGV